MGLQNQLPVLSNRAVVSPAIVTLKNALILRQKEETNRTSMLIMKDENNNKCKSNWPRSTRISVAALLWLIGRFQVRHT